MKIHYTFPIDLSIISPPKTESYSTVVIGRDENKFLRVLYSFFHEGGFVFGFELGNNDNILSAADELMGLLSPENQRILRQAEPIDEYDKNNNRGTVSQIQSILK